MIPFVPMPAFEYGRTETVSPLIRRVIADNPGPFTFTGTGTYVIGRGEAGAGVAVIDPGPLDEAHLAALAAAVRGQTVSHVLVTHTHRDHAPLARPFAEAVGAPVLAARPPARTIHASATPDEDDDEAFSPDIVLMGGERLSGDGWTLEAMATPGHASNHMAFVLAEENALFSGDHVMGWSTTVVAPPDGDMAAYMASLQKLHDRDDRVLYPAHGPAVTNPRQLVRGMLGHRRQRESQIVRLLGTGVGEIPAMVTQMYKGLDPRLHGAAGRSVLAHLVDLERQGRVNRSGDLWTIQP